MEIDSNIFYNVARDGQTFGPFEGSKLIKMAKGNRLLITDYLWTEGMASWLSADLFDTLAAIFEPQENQTPTDDAQVAESQAPEAPETETQVASIQAQPQGRTPQTRSPQSSPYQNRATKAAQTQVAENQVVESQAGQTQAARIKAARDKTAQAKAAKAKAAQTETGQAKSVLVKPERTARPTPGQEINFDQVPVARLKGKA